jgi:MoaA/NifB/PqqE/SkfB family radical SAM enzyme
MTVEVTDLTAPASLYGLSFLWLEITEKCNLECSHCYADSGPHRELCGEMKLEDWETVIRESADLGCRQIQFIGGEPTLHPDLERLIECASERGYTFIEVFTNATTFNEGLYRAFLRAHVQIATSFYSDDPVIHDLITARPGSFSRTVDGIRRIIKGGLHLRAGIIETKENAGHAQKAWHFLNDLGVSDIKVDFQRGVGRGADRLYSPEPMSQLCGECWKGKLCITSSGKAYPCVFSRFAQLGTVTGGIRQIVDGSELFEFRADLSKRQQPRATAEQCSPLGCGPTCSPCGPENFIKCQPGWSDCLPVTRCMPSCAPGTPCTPDTRCGPSSR